MEKQECFMGYPYNQLERILGNRYDEFMKWMNGQTIAMCDGKLYNYASDEYEPTYCGPHGFVVYAWDLQRFLDGKPIID